jgi:hypothetical protein
VRSTPLRAILWSVLRLADALVRRGRRRPGSAGARASGTRSRARFAVAVVPLAFVVVLGAAWAGAESVTPEITDTDYHVRLGLARNARASYPDRPLAVVLGSSRLVYAFRPEQLGPPGPGELNWVNSAHVGAGPTLNCLILYRLLRDGVRPAVVIVEVMPTFFVKENNRLLCSHFAADELSVVRPYSDRALTYDYHFLRHRLTRAGDLARVADPFAGRPEPLPRGGPPDLLEDVTPAERAKRTEHARQHNADFLHRLTVRPGAARALRDTLRQAAENGMRAVVLRMPEGSVFRGWYGTAGLAEFDQFLAAVAAEYSVPILDARLWLADDDFYDYHHVLNRGAQKFTARFAREVSALLK